ncbi:unnamed protein product [Paramecium octaurelia]|uniref:Uncharacterized protein n=1 Tax=Paramecium octaurelia TaxID=43137 RepID=A0A8S1SQ44_PAROT|nr:unnamed protein product [Paramecium octaurelia]
MVKAYFGYKFETLFGSIGNNGGVIINDIAYTIVDQYLLLLNIKTQEIIQQIVIEGKNIKITKIAIKDNTLAIGYHDGEIIIYNLIDNEIQCRFFNHQSEITQLVFLSEAVLISGSCDTSIIVWDLADQQLQFRLIGHSNQITALDIISLEDQSLAITQQFIVSGSKDGLVKIWDLNLECSVATLSSMHSEVTCLCVYENYLLICTNSDEVLIKSCQLISGKCQIDNDGIIKRQSFIRAIQCQYVQQKLLILNNEKKIEVYKSKQGKKLQKAENFSQSLIYSTVISQLNKIVYFQAVVFKNLLKIYIFTSDNQIVIKELNNDNVDENNNVAIQQITGQIKQIKLTQNDHKLVVIASNKCYQFDNETAQQINCLTNTSNLTSLCILPKNKYFMVGDEQGTLYLVDMNQNEIVFEQKIHNSNVNSIECHENCKAFNGLVIMTTEVDKKVNFVELFFNKTQKCLEFQVVNTIYLKENIRSAQFSYDGNYYAFAQMNNIISIYYCDSHKLYLELYGHSLPVLTFAYTSDDTIVISAGADKSIKLWATDFGNCKKTLKAHTAEVIQIKTVNDTHYFFSGCKDNIIKYWDGDTYQLILQFNEALTGIQSMVVGCIGDLFYSATKNGVIRKYVQTKEQIFVSEEEEKRLQDSLMQELQNKNKQQTGFDQGLDQVKKDLTLVQIGQQKLLETEQLMDILEKIKQYRETIDQGEIPNEDLFFNKNVTEYLFDHLQNSDLSSLMKFLHHQHLVTLIDEMNQDIALKQYPIIINKLITYIFNKVDGFGFNSHEIMMKVINIRTQLQLYFKKEKKIAGYNLDILNLMIQDISKNQDDFVFE